MEFKSLSITDVKIKMSDGSELFLKQVKSMSTKNGISFYRMNLKDVDFKIEAKDFILNIKNVERITFKIDGEDYCWNKNFGHFDLDDISNKRRM